MNHHHTNDLHVQLNFAGNGGVIGMTQMKADPSQNPPLFSSLLRIFCPTCDGYLDVNLLVHGFPFSERSDGFYGSSTSSALTTNTQVVVKREVNDPLCSKLEDYQNRPGGKELVIFENFLSFI